LQYEQVERTLQHFTFERVSLFGWHLAGFQYPIDHRPEPGGFQVSV
jgi:hypothetical protein